MSFIPNGGAKQHLMSLILPHCSNKVIHKAIALH